MTLEHAAVDFCERLRNAGIRHFIGGSVASSVWSEPRQTNDVDLVVDVNEENIEQFKECASGDYLFDPVHWERAREDKTGMPMLQVLHAPTMLKFDCYVAVSELEFSEFSRPVTVEIGGHRIPVATAEYSIIAKCRWFDSGNRVSDRQWNDLTKLYDVRRDLLDTDYITNWLGRLRLLDLWALLRLQSPT